MDWAIGLGCALLLITVVVLLVLLARYRAQQERERLQRVHDWAEQHGWAVTYAPPVAWGARLPGGNRRGVSLAVSGQLHGYPVSVADYSYTETTTSTSTDANGHTTTSTTSTTHHLVVTVVRVPGSYPAVAVQPRGAMSKLGRAMFGDSVTAIGNDAFDRAFRVATRTPQAVPQLIGPALAAEHLAGRAPMWSLSGNELMTYRSGRIDDPAAVPVLAGHLVRVAQLLHR